MSDDFVDYVMELFGPFGTVSARRMFGGHGVYLDGLMFALVSGDALYLKADAMNRMEYERAGCGIFSYARKGKRATLGFFRAPEDAMESPELMLPWARTAYAAALRTNAKKQVAEDARASRKIEQTKAEKAARAARSGIPTKKRPASIKSVKKATPTNPVAGNAAKKNTARPATPLKRGKRTQ